MDSFTRYWSSSFWTKSVGTGIFATSSTNDFSINSKLEVVSRAIAVWTPDFTKKLEENLARQEDALSVGNLPAFHALDYDFHKLFYVLSDSALAFEVTMDCKQKVDRLCVLSLGKNSEANSILTDHRNIQEGLASGNQELAQDAVRKHLSRLDDTIEFIHKSHPDYFE